MAKPAQGGLFTDTENWPANINETDLHLDSLDITGFRNLDKQIVHFATGSNLIFGLNGAGKTNLLEAIYYLCTAKSFRSAADEAIKCHDSDLFRIAGTGLIFEEPVTVEVAYRPGEKRHIKIDGVVEKRVASLYERFRAVSFGPGDVELVYGPPTIRRRFLDISIAQVKRGYISQLWEYKKVIAQRNALLKELGDAYDSIGAMEGEELLQVWDQKLIEIAVDIHATRSLFIREIMKLAGEYHQKMSESDSALTICYEASPKLDEYSTECLSEKLKSRRGRELAMRQSMYGPHRDDIIFRLHGQDCRNSASQGQVKTVVLSVKLALCEYIRHNCDETPILLLDEIFSDFDRNRLDCLLSLLPGLSQVMMTTSKLGDIRDLSIFETILMVDSGRVAMYTPQS